MDKFAIYAKAANFNGTILFLMQIYRSASGGDPLQGLCPWSPLGDFHPQALLLVR